MKIKQTIFLISLSLGISGTFLALPSYALTCGGVETSLIACDQDNTGKDVEDTGIWALLLLAINILTAGVGIAAVGGVLYGAILWMTAGGSSDNVKKAITIFRDVVIGIVAYALMYAFLNYIIPGGMIS